VTSVVRAHRSCWSWAAACAGVVALLQSTAITAAAPELAELAVENPAQGVYVHYGQQAETSRANGGDIANVGFVVGKACVAVIDTGGSYAVGRALREAIRRVTSAPVCYVINTHVHPDHVFGNHAFADDRAEFIGHVRLADAMRRRAPHYLAALRRDAGDVADDTEIVLPTRSVADTTDLDLGDRVLTLRAWKTAHTDCDLTVFDRATRTLFVGDLLFVGHIPVVDGSLRGFLGVLDELATVRAEIAVAGHGRARAWPDAIAPQKRYLVQLLADVRSAIKAKRTLAETIDAVRPTTGEWLLVDAFHKRNVSAAYAELEWEE
jgi:quinoprotein relay system zinc metallohydrolase 2